LGDGLGDATGDALSSLLLVKFNRVVQYPGFKKIALPPMKLPIYV
jgi:hypothetical protein